MPHRHRSSNQESPSRRLLVQMLQEAAQLEHCLLNTYLYAACALKSTPQEFEHIGGQVNQRRAVQFERVRGWKQNILAVAHEEMRHLHYVQCMIRALGERPSLGLPARDAQGTWLIPNWDLRAGTVPIGDEGTPVPVLPLNEATLRRFVLYESTDALQDSDPFGESNAALFERLYAFELALRFESMLIDVADEAAKDYLRAQLQRLYQETLPLDAPVRLSERLAPKDGLPDSERLRFQSIADFYRKGILPLYEQAFQEGWVVVGDRNLVDEQLDPNYAGEGFLPVGPIGRSARFARFAQQGNANPLADYKEVAAIVDEIVAEGEGAVDFIGGAQVLLSKIEEIGLGGFLAALAADARDQTGETPEWLAQVQNLRKSHLYLFGMILVEHRLENELAQKSGVSFEASRQPVAVEKNPMLERLTQELPAQFNACYVAMLAWLARMYESRTWASDQSRRMAIEMVATWPLMSLAIRPFLELASFFPIDTSQLFRVDLQSMPMLPVWGLELVELYEAPERSEAINERMDWLVVRVLAASATWAREQIQGVEAAPIPSCEKGMILTRLRALSRLDEFERQFPYRVAGGYSDRSPNLSYQNQHPESKRYEEDPTTLTAPDLPPLFADTLVMRLRFRGWGLVQLATDPDPPTDESGCSGTLMLHAADGDRRFDRALVFQDYAPEQNIRRVGAPPLGVDCIEMALMAPELDGAEAGYRPLQIMQSSGAVQTSGVQQDLVVQGLHEVARQDLSHGVDGHSIQLFLETKQNVRPFLNGDNHLIWQDGEPIDPFILSVYAGSVAGETPPERLFSREVFNEGKSVRQMEPYQRLLSCRGPAGFDLVKNLPGWAQTPEVRAALGTPGFPRGFLRQRAIDLADKLLEALQAPAWDQLAVDTAVSLAERLLLVAQPKGTTVGWLTAMLHYGHTLSGALEVGPTSNPLLEMLQTATGLSLSIAPPAPDRVSSNSRWLIGYTKGLMDVDGISDFVYGELYLPLAVQGESGRFQRTWSFPASMQAALASYACDFAKPFWAVFEISGETRTVRVAGLDPRDPGLISTLVETLEQADATGYSYAMTGFPGMASYRGEFKLQVEAQTLALTWECRFAAATQDALMRCYSLLAASADQIGQDLASYFGPAG